MDRYDTTYNTAIKVVEMLRLLENRYTGSMPVDELADRLEVHRRTIIRYIDAIGGAITNEDGSPLVIREKRGERVVAKLPRKSPKLSGNIFQYAAVFAAARTFEAMKDPVLGFGAANVLERIEEDLLSREQRQLMERVHKGFYYLAFGPKDYEGDEEILDQIVRAVLKTRPLAITYRSRKDQRERRIEPYTLVMYRDGFYVLARVPDAEPEMRRFAVDRIGSVRTFTSETFEVPDEFTPEAFFRDTFGIWHTEDEPEEVVVAFSKEAMKGVKERQWPGFKEVRELEDGRMALVLCVPVTPELVTWVLTWGPHAEVLQPGHLREDIKAVVSETLALYR